MRLMTRQHAVAGPGSLLGGAAALNGSRLKAMATLKKHSILIAGHATSISLEEEFWAALRQIAAADGVSLNRLVADVDSARDGNLSSALRLFVLRRLQADLARSTTENPP